MPYKQIGPVTLADLGDRNFATIPETASILEYDPRTIALAIRRGDIPAVKVGQTYRVPVTWLRSAAASQPVGGAA